MPVIELLNCEIRDKPSFRGEDLVLPLSYQSRFELGLELSRELNTYLMERGIYRRGRIPTIKKISIIIEY